MVPVPPLIGSYTPPRARKGRRVTCLFRDALCAVTSVSGAPIPWPRACVVGRKGRPTLWVNDELARAIRTESAVALKHHFGVTDRLVAQWCEALGVGGRATTEGSRRALHAAAVAGARATKAKVWTAEERAAQAARSKRLGLRPTGGTGREWTPEQLALLGTDRDAVIAQRIGRTACAVTCQRTQRKIPAFPGGRVGGEGAGRGFPLLPGRRGRGSGPPERCPASACLTSGAGVVPFDRRGRVGA